MSLRTLCSMVAAMLLFGGCKNIPQDKTDVPAPSVEKKEPPKTKNKYVFGGAYQANHLDGVAVQQVYRFFNGSCITIDFFLGKLHHFYDATGDSKLAPQPNIVGVLQYAEPFQRLDLGTDLRVERFIQIAYDADKDGKLSSEEVNDGDKKLHSFLQDLAVTAVPSDGEPHVIFPLDMLGGLDGFEKRYQAFVPYDLGKQGKSTPHLDKLRALVGYLEKLGEKTGKRDCSHDCEVRLDEGESPDAIFSVSYLSHTKQYYSANPKACGIFIILAGDGTLFMDSYPDGLLDGTLDYVSRNKGVYRSQTMTIDNGQSSYDNHLSETSTSTDNPGPSSAMQRRFERLVDHAYQSLIVKNSVDLNMK